VKPFQIFRSGTHTPMKGSAIAFSDADLQAAAAAYDPAAHEAPIVVGHPKSDAPAYGWVKSLSFQDGQLVAEPDQVDGAFAELVQAGRFKKVSASFYPPDAAANPKPGTYYLRHVGFLGAQPPAVKGLKAVNFAAGDEGVIEFADDMSGFRDRGILGVLGKIRDLFIEKFGAEEADRAIPADQLEWLRDNAIRAESRQADLTTGPAFTETDPTTKETEVDLAELQRRKDELDARQAQLDQQAAAFAEREAATRHTENKSFLDGLVAAGKLAPGIAAPALAFMDRLDAAEVIEFAEGAQQTSLDWFKDLLGKSGQVVDFSEKSATDGDGDQVDLTNAEDIAAKAVAFQEAEAKEGRIVSADVAVRHVMRQAAA
jgi:hypothetical protein